LHDERTKTVNNKNKVMWVPIVSIDDQVLELCQGQALEPLKTEGKKKQADGKRAKNNELKLDILKQGK